MRFIWKTDLQTAPHNKEVLIKTSTAEIMHATYDPDWGDTKGGWFTLSGKFITNVVAWYHYTETADVTVF